jgi:hypothetical protein
MSRHRGKFEDLDAVAALALGEEGVAFDQRACVFEAVGLDDRIAVLVTGRRARSIVTASGGWCGVD